MANIANKCPHCGSTVYFEENQEYTVCEYCNSQVYAANSTLKVKHDVTNEADLIRAHIELDKYNRQMKYEEEFQELLDAFKKKRNNLFRIDLILFVVGFFLAILGAAIDIEIIMSLGIILFLVSMFMFIGLFVYFIITKPRNRHKKKFF